MKSSQFRKQYKIHYISYVADLRDTVQVIRESWKKVLTLFRDSSCTANEGLWILNRSDKSGLISLRAPRIAFKSDRTCTFGHARLDQCETFVFPSYIHTRRIDLLACTCNTMYLFLFVRERSSLDPLGLIFLLLCFCFYLARRTRARRTQNVDCNKLLCACVSG